MKKIILPIVLTCALLGCEQQQRNEQIKMAEPLTLSASEQKALEKTNDYAWRMLQASYDDLVGEKTDVNHFVSPLSAAMVLGMMENGAANETRSEMLEVLGFDADSEKEMNAYYSRMMKELPVRSEYSTVHLANAVWVDNEFTINDDYRGAITTQYLAAVENGDFSNPATATEINKWCADNTGNKITKIVTAEQLRSNVLALLNALYFRSDWQTQFDKERTKDETFYAIGQMYQVKLMHNTDQYRTVENDLLRMLEVDYKGGAYCMDFILPAGDKKISDVLHKLDSRLFSEAIDGLVPQELDIAIPKFKMSYECELNESFKAMGMKQAFDADNADFSRMAPEDIFITLIKQKTTLEIDEEGTVATAITSIMGATASPIETFYVNQPFILVIRERQSNIILFAGIINKP